MRWRTCEPRHRAGVPVAVRRRHLGHAPRLGVDDARARELGRIAIRVVAHPRRAGQRRRVGLQHPLKRCVLGRRRTRDDIRAAGVQGGRQPDEELDAGRSGQPLAKIGPQALASHAAHDLPDEEPLRVDVVAVTASGLPPWRLRRQRAGHDAPVRPRARRQRAIHGRQAGLVRQQVAKGHVTSVSRSHGRVRAASAWPPQTSTTGRPLTATASAAPTSAPEVRMSRNASRTRANAGSHDPCTSGPPARRITAASVG